MKNKPYEIEQHQDGRVTLHIGGVEIRFGRMSALRTFANDLKNELVLRQVGMFRLQDTQDGCLQLIMNKQDITINIKNYEQAHKLADMLLEDLEL